MAGNQRDEKIRYVFEADGAETLGSIEKTLGDITEKGLGTETAFSFVKQHLEEITAAALALKAAVAGIEFGKESVANAASLEESLSRVRAIAGDTADQFDDMDGAISDAAQSVDVDSQTATAGLTALLGAGLDLKSGMEALVPTLQLAKIANIDVGTAADTVAKTLAAFNLPASDAQKVVDELTIASHGAAGGLAAMSEATGRLAPDAKAIGLNFEQLTAIVGTLGQRGISGREALSGLRTVFQELENPTSKLRLELSSMGDDTDDFGKALATLTSGTPRAKEVLLGLNGSARTVIQSLGAQGPEAIEKFVAKLNDASGAAGKTASALDDNLNGAWKKFGLSVDEIGEKLAKPVLEPLKDELVKLAGELNKFADSPDFKDIESQVGAMAKNGAKALDEFLHNVDWKTFLADAKSTFAGMADGFNTLANKASTAASTVSSAINIIDGAYQAAGVAIDGAVHVAAKGIDTMAASATGGASNLSELHNVLTDVADTAGDQMVDRMGKLSNILDGAAASTDKETVATTKQGAATKQASAEATAHAEATTKETAAQNEGAASANAASQAHQKLAQAIAQTKVQVDETADSLKAFPDRLRDFEAEGERAANNVGAVKTAFAALKLTSQADLEQAAEAAAKAFGTIDAASANTAQGLADKQKAFLAYAKAALAASANLDEGAKASTQYLLESKASALGVLDALTKIEESGKTAGDSVATGAAKATAALQGEAQAASSVVSAVQDIGDNVTDMAAGGGAALATLDGALQNSRQGFLAVSDAAAKAFDERIYAGGLQLADDIGTGFDAMAERIVSATKIVTQEVADQRVQLQGMIDNINNGGEKSIATIDNMITSIKNGSYQFGILGKQDLAPLLSALEAAKQKTQAAEQAAQAAAQRFDQLAQSIHDSLLQEKGDQIALEDERHQKQLADLQAEAKAAGTLNSQAYQQAVNEENQLHDLKMKNLQDQAKQQSAQNGGSSGGASGSSRGASSSGAGAGGARGPGGGADASSPGGGGFGATAVPISLTNNGRSITIIAGNESEADTFEIMMQEIARQRTNSIHK